MANVLLRELAEGYAFPPKQLIVLQEAWASSVTPVCQSLQGQDITSIVPKLYAELESLQILLSSRFCLCRDPLVIWNKVCKRLLPKAQP